MSKILNSNSELDAVSSVISACMWEFGGRSGRGRASGALRPTGGGRLLVADQQSTDGIGHLYHRRKQA